MAMTKGKVKHPILQQAIQDIQADKIDRREFLAIASTFDASAAFAYGVLGQPPPAMVDLPPRLGPV